MSAGRRGSDAPGPGRRYLGFLAYAIAGESRAYGFTLVVWSTGATLVARDGLPNEPQVLLFVAGALVGFVVALLLAFHSVTATYHRSEAPPRYAFSEFHVISILAAVGGGYVTMLLTAGALAFFLSALVAVTVFQLVLPLEIMVSTVKDRRRRPAPEVDTGRGSDHGDPDERLERLEAEVEGLRASVEASRGAASRRTAGSAADEDQTGDDSRAA